MCIFSVILRNLVLCNKWLDLENYATAYKSSKISPQLSYINGLPISMYGKKYCSTLIYVLLQIFKEVHTDDVIVCVMRLCRN